VTQQITPAVASADIVQRISQRLAPMAAPGADAPAQVVCQELSLSPREMQVLMLIADGKSTKEVAAILGISYKTADCHRSKLLQKFDVHESVSLIRRAIRAGIIEP
jgi:DNA-binding CsgD family transcriptional regulator